LNFQAEKQSEINFIDQARMSQTIGNFTPIQNQVMLEKNSPQKLGVIGKKK
jgi:hypothetical protein